ncbi:MAG: pilus assembly protein PilP [Methylotenera sp.]|nr:pilus assembly protein PilP [Oligoflexia bacterium]
MKHLILTFLLVTSVSFASEPPPAELLTVRDPFKRPEMPKTKIAIKSELEKFPTTDYKMVGVLTGPEKMRAMVKAPDGRTYFVYESMKMGIREGVIRKITTETILVREKIVNILGQEENIDTELQLVSK